MKPNATGPGGRLGLSDAADCKPIVLIVVASTGARTIEEQAVRVVRSVESSADSRRPVVAARPAIAEGATAVVAGIDTVERASDKFCASIVATY